MKRNLLAITLTSVALACLAGLDYSDIVKWGLLRRSDVAALLPDEGYRMLVVTNYTPSFAWTLDGYFEFDAGNETYPTAISVSNLQIPGLPKTLVMDGMNGMVPVPEHGYIVGAFDNGEGTSGVGVLNGDSQFGSAGFYSTQGVDGSGFNFTQGVANFYWGAMTLTRTDYPDIVTVTTNYFATGGGAVLRDSRNPRKSVRLVDGALLLLEEIPAHWVFQGVPCFGLSNPLTSFSGSLAGYAWATETAGDPPYLYYALYDVGDVGGTRRFASDAFSGVTASLSFYPDFEPYEVAPMMYVGPSVTTNSL
jgi:hypothetical protein